MEDQDSVTYTIKGAGPNEDTLHLDFIDGCNVLIGPNAAGKTTAIDALRRTGGDESVKVVVNRESGVCQVEGPGVVLRVGGRTTRRGSPIVELINSGELHKLMDPTGETTKTRRKNQALTLLDLYANEVTQEQLLAICSGDKSIAAGVQGQGKDKTLKDVAGGAKRFADALALNRETEASEFEGAAKAARKRLGVVRAELGGAPRPEGDVATQTEEVNELTAALGGLDTERKVRVAREEEREKARGLQLKTRPDTKEPRALWVGTLKTLERLKGEVKAAEEALEIRERLMNLAKDDAAEWDERQKLLDEEITGPSHGDIELAEIHLADVQADLETLCLYEALDGATLALEDARAGHGVKAQEAADLRSKARSVAQVVNKILSEENFGGLQLDAEFGLSYCGSETGGVVQPFEELSAGQKARAVLLGVGLLRYPGRMIPVDPKWFWQIQPARMRELVQLAIDEGIKLVTELATDRPGVAVVYLGEEWIVSGKRGETWIENGGSQGRSGGAV